MQELLEFILARYNYWLYIVLMMIGFYAMIAKNNFVKKIAGMNIFQTAIILFYISIGYKKDATIPILVHAADGAHHAVHAADYVNPLPHVLMLTAIVVSVATLGVALALALKVYQSYGTLEEDEIRERMREKAFTTKDMNSRKTEETMNQEIRKDSKHLKQSIFSSLQL